jgi:ribosomal protein S12 methylthiotransferase
MRSRTVASLVAEARRLAEQGVVELNLVSQDSTSYGRDLQDGSSCASLLRALARIDGICWIRLHYVYPLGVPDDLLRAIADEPKVVKYLDMPLQHASGRMLKAMRRGVSRDGQERILARVRDAIPGIAVRTTFIVGFPGETEEDFQALVDFVKVSRFERVGVFTYSPEDGTPAAEMGSAVPESVKKARQRELMKVQASVSRSSLRRLVGTRAEVLVDGPSKESEFVWAARLPTQSPEIDGQVYVVSPPEDLRAGQFRTVRITRASAHDLVGEVA